MATNLDIGRVYKRFQERASAQTANVLSYQMVSDNVARVIMGVNKLDLDINQAHMVIAAAFDNYAAPIEGSFRIIPNAQVPAIIGFVTHNTEVREYASLKGGKTREMAGNLLMDDTDGSLWEVKEGEAGRFLVRHQEESLAELVQLAKVQDFSARNRIPEVASFAEEREFVAFVNVETSCMDYGYVANVSDNDTMRVVTKDNGTVEISNLQVVEIAAITGQPALASGDKSDLEAYYKELYADSGLSADYYAMIKKQIEMHSFA